MSTSPTLVQQFPTTVVAPATAIQRYPDGQASYATGPSWDQVAQAWRNPAPQWSQPTFHGAWAAPVQRAVPTSDEVSLAAMAHWLGLFVTWLAPVIVLAANNGRSEFVRRHAVAAVNFHLSMVLWVMLASFASLLIIGIPFLLALMLYMVVGPIQGALAAGRGQDFRYAMTIDFLK